MTNGIIVDGAEQQGKSTFTEKLSKLTNLPIIHMDKEYGFINGKFDYIESYFIDINKENGVIFDRHFISEICYGKLFNRNNITKEIIKENECRLNKLNYIYIILEMKEKEWIEREEYIDESQNNKIKQYFRELYESSNINNKFYIDPRNDNAIEFIFNKWKNLK
jgi:thymidylate kinase